jgi:hypothetical protein
MARITKLELANLYKVTKQTLYKKIKKARFDYPKVFEKYHNCGELLPLPLQLAIYKAIGEPPK